MGHSHKHTFCAEDAPFINGKPKRVVWKPNCRENAPDPGKSLLGAVLNADPIGNAKFVIDQVNTLRFLASGGDCKFVLQILLSYRFLPYFFLPSTSTAKY